MHLDHACRFAQQAQEVGQEVLAWLERDDGLRVAALAITQRHRLHARTGRSVGVFPEGRTRDGREVGPFHARIFLAAVEAGARVQPVARRYGQGGDAQTVVAFQPGETFLANFLRLLGEPARVVEVHFLAPIGTADTAGRRRIAELARERIVAAMQAA